MTLKLSSRPDGHGFFYGFLDGDDHRQVNIRWEEAPPAWHVYVGGEKIGREVTIDHAKDYAVQWMDKNPD